MKRPNYQHASCGAGVFSAEVFDRVTDLLAEALVLDYQERLQVTQRGPVDCGGVGGNNVQAFLDG